MARSDVQLMLGVRAGDEESFARLLERYRSPVIHFLYRMVRDATLAEDLAQEVFLRVYRARRKYAPSAKFTTWLFRIAANLALNALRDARHRRAEISLDAPPEEDAAPAEAPDGAPPADERLIEQERAAAIFRAVSALPEKQRAAVLLHKYEGMDYRDIGSILGLSESALKSLLFRAYETLRVQLAPLVAGRQS